MYLIKKIAREYFVFHKKEKDSLLSVSFLTILLLFALMLQKFLFPFELPEQEKLKFELIATQNRQRSAQWNKPKYARKFNPADVNKKWDVNKMSIDDWIEFGLSPRQAAATFSSIRKKGGIINLNGLKTIKYIPDFLVARSEKCLIFSKESTIQKDVITKKTEEKTTEPFDINSINSRGLRLTCQMDSLEVKSFLIYRKRLGGFFCKQQVSEVYGLDSTSKKIIHQYGLVDTAFIKKIKLNYVDIKELSKHPYFNYNMATAVVNYRYKHGLYQNCTDLLKLVAMTPEKFSKIRPYISTEP